MKESTFTGLSLDTRDLSDARTKNAAYVERRINFREMFKKLEEVPAKHQVKALRKFIFEDNNIDNFVASELMQVFTAFRERRSFQDILRGWWRDPAMRNLRIPSSYGNPISSPATICVITTAPSKRGEALMAAAPSAMGHGKYTALSARPG
jgi:hypothetical protein